jgi:hypothetical protein
MTSVIDIAKKLKGNKCAQLVKYTGQEYTISGANVGVGSFKIDIGSFANKIKEINAVPPVMMALDNNQYLLCQQASQLKDNPQLKDMCLRIRLMHIMAFTQLQALLSIPTPNEELGKQILEWTVQMNKLTSQSIDLLKPQPNVTLLEKKAPTKSLGPNPTVKAPARKSTSSTVKLKVKPALTAIMKYQGINEAQMQDALKTIKE